MSILILSISLLFAHESLDSISCKNSGSQELKIEKLKDHKYRITPPGRTAPVVLKEPESKDVFDPKMKQLFDTYTFKVNGLDLVVRRPETKGPQKTETATWDGSDFNCKKM